MAKILFNKEGNPLMAFGHTYFATTTGAPAEVKTVKLVKPVKPIEELDTTETFNQYAISPWGTANDFPVKALDIIGRTGVLNTGLKYIRNFTMGQRIFPVRVTGYNDKGDEILSVINDPKITTFQGAHRAPLHGERLAGLF